MCTSSSLLFRALTRVRTHWPTSEGVSTPVVSAKQTRSAPAFIAFANTRATASSSVRLASSSVNRTHNPICLAWSIRPHDHVEYLSLTSAGKACAKTYLINADEDAYQYAPA